MLREAEGIRWNYVPGGQGSWRGLANDTCLVGERAAAGPTKGKMATSTISLSPGILRIASSMAAIVVFSTIRMPPDVFMRMVSSTFLLLVSSSPLLQSHCQVVVNEVVPF